VAELDLDCKAEAAIQAVIRAELATLEAATAGSTNIAADHVFTSFSDTFEIPEASNCIVSSMGGFEDGHRSGNERLTVKVTVRTPGLRQESDTPGESRARHRVNCGQVFDALKTTTIASDLSAAEEDFTVFPSVQFRRGPNKAEKVLGKPYFFSVLMLEFACCPSDIS